MYMIKAQKKLAGIEQREEEERRIDAMGGLKIVQGAVSPDMPEDGPTGAKKKVKYVGSFKVFPPPGLTGKDLTNAISGFVWDRVVGINPKRISNPVSGTIVVNRYGIRLYKDKTLFMSYPIKRISYCTAVPKNALFAVVTRNLQSQPTDVIYCHVFGLPNAEHASELSQLMSHAFKLALAQRTLRRSLERDNKEGKKSKLPWEVLRRKDKKKKTSSTSPTPTSSSAPPRSQNSSKPSNLAPPPPPVAPGYSQSGGATPFMNRHSDSISSSDVSVEGLETEIVYLEQQIITTETQLQSLPPTGNEALELIIQLSAYEDTLQVKKHQLITLQLMPSSTPPPTAPPISYDQLMRDDEMTGGTPMSHLMPPSYDDLQGGGGAVGGGNRYSQNFDDVLILQDADWYQAGLPREIVMDILSQEPPGSFIVRDSASNPGCHALSVKSPDGQVMHYLIVKDASGYYIQGCALRHTNLLSLITYHASTVDFIPTTLSLGSTNFLTETSPQQPSSGMLQHGLGGETPWLCGSDSDSDIDDDEMIQHLEQMQLINP